MAKKMLINLATGLGDAERVTVCPISFTARKLDQGELVANDGVAGATPMLEWIGDDDALVFSY